MLPFGTAFKIALNCVNLISNSRCKVFYQKTSRPIRSLKTRGSILLFKSISDVLGKDDKTYFPKDS